MSSPSPTCTSRICPTRTTLPTTAASPANQFVNNPDGSVYVGIVWPGPSVFPDFTRAAHARLVGHALQPFVQDGVAGFWNDMNEPSVFNTPDKTMPLDVVHRIDEPRLHSAHRDTRRDPQRLRHGKLARHLRWPAASSQPDERPFVLTRATYAGGQRYAATWTGDNSSTWNHLRMTAPMLKNLGLSGFTLRRRRRRRLRRHATAGSAHTWIEVAAFQPIDRDHTEKGTGDQEPWVGRPRAGSHPPALHRRALPPHALPLHARRRDLAHRPAHHASRLSRLPATPPPTAIPSTSIRAPAASSCSATTCSSRPRPTRKSPTATPSNFPRRSGTTTGQGSVYRHPHPPSPPSPASHPPAPTSSHSPPGSTPSSARFPSSSAAAPSFPSLHSRRAPPKSRKVHSPCASTPAPIAAARSTSTTATPTPTRAATHSA